MWGLRMRGMWTGQKEGNSPKLYLRVDRSQRGDVSPVWEEDEIRK